MRFLRATHLLVALAFASIALAGLTPATVVPGGLSQPLIGDINGDGLTDIVQDRVVYLNVGGTFVQHDLGIRKPVSNAYEWNGGDGVIALLDVNGDGRLDLLTKDRPAAPPHSRAKAESYRLYIAGNEVRYRNTPIELGTNFDPYVTNANDDGKDDIILFRGVAGIDRYAHKTYAIILTSNGDGTFVEHRPIFIPNNPQSIFSTRNVLSGDIDKDGHSDLVIHTEHDLVLLRGRGNGEFAAPENRFAWFQSRTPVLADVDGDGNLDYVSEAFRGVNVLFGDGTGRFPRFGTVSVPRVREVPHLAQDEMQYQAGNVRRMVVGEWVRQGRTEIAIGTPEGDAVNLAYENGKMAEVGRFETEFMSNEMYAGSFFEAGKRDLYVIAGMGLPSERPQPRLFDADPAPASSPAVVSRGRARAVRGFVAPTLEFDVTITGNCVPEGVQRWSLTREGIFGLDQREGYKVETVYMTEGHLLYRLTVPWSNIPIVGWVDYSTFRSKAGTWVGSAGARTACGEHAVKLSAVQR